MYKDSSSSNFALNIFSMQGQKVHVDVMADTLIEAVKDEAIKKFSAIRGNGFDNTSEYVLITAVGPCRRLSNKNTVKCEDLTVSNVLLLFKIQGEGQKTTETVTRSIPTMPGIRRATEGLIPKGKTTNEPTSSGQSSGGNLEHTFRKILLTLLDLSYKLMFFDKEADGLFSSKIKHTRIDPSLIKSLTAMGFTEARACKALRVNQMDVEAAMEWLLRNPEDTEAVTMEVDTNNTEEDTTDDEDEDRHSAKRVKRRLESWQKKSKRREPSKENVSTLVTMGFTQEESIQALKLNGNITTSACDWLLGERKVPDDDPNESLPPSSELYKAIVSNPTIHIGLHNKRVLEALEDMIVNPSRRHNWANDPTVGSVILQILKLYHKYSNSGS